MKRVIFALVLINFINAEDFISEFEYGQMLFSNPRGVSCAKCHGDLGRGEYIGEFIDKKGKVHKFYGPDITNISKKRFKKALEKGGLIMPRYYLTQKEIDAIYMYIKEVNKNKDIKEQNSSLIKAEDNLTEDENLTPDMELNEYEDMNFSIDENIDDENGDIIEENNKENSIIYEIFYNISDYNETGE